MEYEPGQILDENKIAKEFRVSRTPVREAVMRLEWERLIEVVPRGGIFVSRIEIQKLKEVLNVRKNLEGQLARIAALNRKDHHIKALGKLKSNCLKSKKSKEIKDVINLDIKMRSILYDATKASIINQITELLYCQTFRIWLMLSNNIGLERMLQVQVEKLDHYIKAMTDRDGDEAEIIGVKLFNNYIERLNVYFSTL